MIKSSLMIVLFAVFLTAVFVPSEALAASKEKSLGSFGVWQAYSYNEGGQSVCYMVTTKIVKSTGPSKRGLPYLMITHRPIEASTDVISYGAGAALNSRHGVRILVGKNTFELFSVRDTAWARDSQTDHKLAAALQSFAAAQVSALPDKKGSKAFLDSFDLTGAPLAYHAIGRACGLEPAPKKSTPIQKTPPAQSKTSKKRKV